MYPQAFCSIDIIGHNNIVEVIPNRGIEITPEMMTEFFDYLSAQNIYTDISILLNKVASYSYKFETLVSFSQESRVKNIAVVSYDKLSTSTSLFMRQSFNRSGKSIEIFHSRDEALVWLNMVTS